MAAIMKYVQLQHEDFTELMKQAESNDKPLYVDVKETQASKGEALSSTKSSASRTSNPLLSRLEAYRSAYLALTPPDNFDTPLYKSVEIVSGTVSSNGMSCIATFRVKFSSTTFGSVPISLLVRTIRGRPVYWAMHSILLSLLPVYLFPV